MWVFGWFCDQLHQQHPHFSKNTVNHEHHVRLILEKLRKVGLYAKLEKCGFYQSKVEFLGYILFGNGVRMDLHKVQTIVDWATQAYVWDVQCFLRFANFYHYTLFRDNDPFCSFNSKGSTFFLGSWSWKCCSIFEGLLHDSPTFDS